MDYKRKGQYINFSGRKHIVFGKRRQLYYGFPCRSPANKNPLAAITLLYPRRVIGWNRRSNYGSNIYGTLIAVR